MTENPLLRYLEAKSGRIAYIGTDGNLYITDQGGVETIRMTEDGSVQDDRRFISYISPTWSPDSSSLAYVRVASSGGAISSVLMRAPAGGGRVEELFDAEGETPTYVAWSHDSQAIGFITRTQGRFDDVLRWVPADASGRSIVLDAGTPLYWSWASGSRRVIVHADQDAVPRLAFLEIDEEGEISEERFNAQLAPFQAPAFSSDGELILVAAANPDGQNALYLINSAGVVQRELTTYEGSIAFAWSPDNEQVAYIAGQPDAGGELSRGGPLRVMGIDAAGEAAITSPEEDVFAFFWSRNSEKIAYFVRGAPPAEGEDDPLYRVAEENGAAIIDGYVLDVASGSSRQVLRLIPTSSFLAVLRSFDQYHQTSTIWSPNSELFVVTGFTLQGGPAVVVVDSTGAIEPRLVTPGLMAFWSWE